MRNLLKQHQKKSERYKSKSFIIYEPTDYQREELASIIVEILK